MCSCSQCSVCPQPQPPHHPILPLDRCTKGAHLCTCWTALPTLSCRFSFARTLFSLMPGLLGCKLEVALWGYLKFLFKKKKSIVGMPAFRALRPQWATAAGWWSGGISREKGRLSFVCDRRLQIEMKEDENKFFTLLGISFLFKGLKREISDG